MLKGVKAATCYPSIQNQIKGNRFRDERVVVSEKCVTSQGPGTSLEFALKLVEKIVGQKVAD